MWSSWIAIVGLLNGWLLAGEFLDPDLREKLLRDQIGLQQLKAEFQAIKEDREFLRTTILPLFQDDKVFLPVNIKRLIWNAQKLFHVSQVHQGFW
jgi:DNA-directed RNA polymerase II subunit RPB1